MIVKEKFDLLRNTDNVTNLSKSKVKSSEIDIGPRKIFVNLEMEQSRINHYTKDKVFKLISAKGKREKELQVVVVPEYPLSVTYNKPTKSQIINLHPFGIDDISTGKPGYQNLYALMVYSITFSSLVTGKFKVSDKYATPIANYFTSIFIRLFGKEYGLLGSYTREINKLKFLINAYVLASFFGKEGAAAFKRAGAAAAFDYKPYADKLKRYDFKNINDFILSLSEMGVMPNLSVHYFAQKVLRQFGGVGFLPALEDGSRFISTIATSNIKGSNVVSTYLNKYDQRSFNQILEISQTLFSRR